MQGNQADISAAGITCRKRLLYGLLATEDADSKFQHYFNQGGIGYDLAWDIFRIHPRADDRQGGRKTTGGVMKAPDKIYVRKYRDGETSMFWDEEPYEDEIAGIKAVEFIRKDALLEWAKKQLEQYVKLQYAKHQDPVHWGQRNAFQQVIDKLNEM